MSAADEMLDGEGGPRGQREPGAPGRLLTTLYELMQALQEALEPGEEDLVVPTVVEWFRAGRLTFLRAGADRRP
jgi:hypothetical protein